MLGPKVQNEAYSLNSYNSKHISWRYASLAFLLVFVLHLVWIWQGFDMTDEGFNLTNQWLMINANPYYEWSSFNGMIWLSDLAGGIWLKIIGDLGLIGARLGWALVMGLTGLVAYLTLKRYFHPLISLLGVTATALASMYHDTMTINYNNFPALLLVGAAGLLLVSQERGASRRSKPGFAVLGGLLLGLGVMARLPLVLSLFLPFVPPIVQALLTHSMPSKSSLIRAFVSLGSAIMTILACFVFLYLTNHLTEYWKTINSALFGASSSSSHAPAYLLHLYYRTGKLAMFWGLKFLFTGFAIALGLIGLSRLIGKVSRRAAKIRAIGVVSLIIGILLVIASFTVLTPAFIARHLSSDGILEDATLLHIQKTRIGTRLGAGFLALLGVVLFLFQWFPRRHRAYFSKVRIYWHWIPVILFGCLFLGLAQQQVGGRYQYSLALPGICFVLGTVLVLLGVFSRRWLTAERLNRFVLLGMGFSVAVVSFIGSNNGISNAKNGLWLLFPAAFLLIPESLEKVLQSMSSIAKRTKQKALSARYKQGMAYFTVAAMCAFALVGFHIRAENPYRDLTDRSKLTAQLEHKRVRGIFTSPGRAESIRQLLDELDHLVKPGDVILTYNCIPMLHYITKTVPALGNPWPTLMPSEELKERLNQLKRRELPSVVVLAKTNTRIRTWGTQTITSFGQFQEEQLLIGTQWIKGCGYHVAWANRDFAIYKRLPEASSTSNIARSLFGIEDGFQAIGAEYRSDAHSFPRNELNKPHKLYEPKKLAPKAGTIGHLGCFSFYPTKNLGAYGDGGMVITNDDALAERVRILRVHGSKPKYYHRLVGTNSRLDAIQVAILSVKLEYLDDWPETRAHLADRYDEALGGVEGIITPYRAPDRSHIFHQYTIRVLEGRRDALRDYLKDEGIGTMIYYPLPLHLQESFSRLGYREGDLPESEKASREVLSLPIFPELTEAEQKHVGQAIKAFFD